MGYRVGDLVVHCRDGVSAITGERTVGDKIYFVIQPQEGSGDVIFVPEDNVGTLIRPIISIEMAKQIIEEMKTIETETFSNTKQRRDNFHRRIASGNPRDLAFLTRQLYLFNKLNSEGVTMKLGPSDLLVLETAKKMFFKELSIAFNRSPEEIESLFL